MVPPTTDSQFVQPHSTGYPSPVLPLRVESWGPGPHPFVACSICGEPWRPFALSRLPGHARCLFTPADQARLLALSATTTDRELSAALGIPPAVLRANLHAALVRAGRPGLRR